MKSLFLLAVISISTLAYADTQSQVLTDPQATEVARALISTLGAEKFICTGDLSNVSLGTQDSVKDRLVLTAKSGDSYNIYIDDPNAILTLHTGQQPEIVIDNYFRNDALTNIGGTPVEDDIISELQVTTSTDDKKILSIRYTETSYDFTGTLSNPTIGLAAKPAVQGNCTAKP